MSAETVAQLASPVRAGPATLQLASGALGALLAVAFLCPAVGVASLGALSDGRRYVGASRAANPWRVALAGVGALALLSIVYPFWVDHTVAAWPMLAFAVFGLLANAASVLAAMPERLSALHPSRLHASSAGYALLAIWGGVALVWPAGWVCVAAVAASAAVFALERWPGARRT